MNQQTRELQALALRVAQAFQAEPLCPPDLVAVPTQRGNIEVRANGRSFTVVAGFTSVIAEPGWCSNVLRHCLGVKEPTVFLIKRRADLCARLTKRQILMLRDIEHGMVTLVTDPELLAICDRLLVDDFIQRAVEGAPVFMLTPHGRDALAARLV